MSEVPLYTVKPLFCWQFATKFGDVKAGEKWFADKVSPIEREFFTDNLLVRIHFIMVMIRWTGLAPWEFEFPFPGSLTSTFLKRGHFVLSGVQISPLLTK